jgi:hypothetical protein
MVIGGQAVIVRGDPRLTRDIDVTVGVGTEAIPTLLLLLADLGLAPLPEDPAAFARQTMVIPAADPASGVRVDLILSWTAFEAEAGVPLERFFQRWILGYTLPQVRLSWRMDPDDTHVFVRIEQTGDTFDFPLLLTMQFQNGQTGHASLRVDGSVHEVRLPVPGPVRQIDTRDDLGLVTVRR